jgi:hypothetical protein
MNFLQLVQRTARECGVTGVGPTTVINQTGQAGRLVNWVNESWNDIQCAHQDWQWLRQTASFPSAAGQAIYSTVQCGIQAGTFGMWARDTFRNYVNPAVTLSIASPCIVGLPAHGLSVGQTITPFTDGALPTGLTAGVAYYVQSVPSADTLTVSATNGGAALATTGSQSGNQTATSNNTINFAGLRSEVFMDYLDYDSWRNAYLYGALRNTKARPSQVTIAPDKSIGLGPVPNSGYTALGDFFAAPSYMTLDVDIPALPTQFHMGIVYRAMMAYGGFESASEVYQKGELEFNKIMRRLDLDRLPEVTFGGALC